MDVDADVDGGVDVLGDGAADVDDIDTCELVDGGARDGVYFIGPDERYNC